MSADTQPALKLLEEAVQLLPHTEPPPQLQLQIPARTTQAAQEDLLQTALPETYDKVHLQKERLQATGPLETYTKATSQKDHLQTAPPDTCDKGSDSQKELAQTVVAVAAVAGTVGAARDKDRRPQEARTNDEGARQGSDNHTIQGHIHSQREVTTNSTKRTSAQVSEGDTSLKRRRLDTITPREDPPAFLLAFD